MSMRVYAVYGLALRVSKKFIKCVERDIKSGITNEFIELVKEDRDYDEDLENKMWSIMTVLRENYDCNCDNDESYDIDFTEVNLETGKIEGRSGRNDYGYFDLSWWHNLYKTPITHKDTLIEEAKSVLPYIPEGYNVEEDIVWYTGTIFG